MRILFYVIIYTYNKIVNTSGRKSNVGDFVFKYRTKLVLSGCLGVRISKVALPI